LAGHHYGIFPRPLGQIIQQAHVNELFLSFSKNSWNTAAWGLPVLSVASGAELYSWTEDQEGFFNFHFFVSLAYSLDFLTRTFVLF